MNTYLHHDGIRIQGLIRGKYLNNRNQDVSKVGMCYPEFAKDLEKVLIYPNETKAFIILRIITELSLNGWIWKLNL